MGLLILVGLCLVAAGLAGKDWTPAIRGPVFFIGLAMLALCFLLWLGSEMLSEPEPDDYYMPDYSSTCTSPKCDDALGNEDGSYIAD